MSGNETMQSVDQLVSRRPAWRVLAELSRELRDPKQKKRLRHRAVGIIHKIADGFDDPNLRYVYLSDADRALLLGGDTTVTTRR